MIVKNEAQRLPACLDSVRHWVDELIVVDTGSEDQTVAIAQHFGAQVFHFPWQNDFSAARNFSLSHAHGDWILVLDADETFVAETFDRLRSHLSQPDLLVINLLRQEIGASQSPYSLVSRLFRRHPALCFSRPYHAMIDDSVLALCQQEPHWKIVDLPEIALRHDGYGQAAVASRNKFDRAQFAMETFLASHPDDTYDAAKLGALYVEQGEWAKGMALLERGICQLEGDGAGLPAAAAPMAQTRYELHYHLAIAHNRLGNAEAAAEHYQIALEQAILPLLKLGAYNNLAGILKDEGFYAAAQELYEQTLTIDPQFAIGYYNLGSIRRQLGDLAGAIAAYETALQLAPEMPEIHQNLAVALLKAGLLERSQQAFERAIALYEQQSPPPHSPALQLRQQLSELGLFEGI
ncbi:MAG: glycosyltransferase [Synechococcales cyanobacterium CRU_2_2]|nr:glycosyltransferase [Synechococcales cyanobacterium CRU_2_2]